MYFLEYILKTFEKGNLITYLIYTSYFIYAIIYLGIFYINPYYVKIINIITQFYIGVTLIYYFNPITELNNISKNMKKIIFISGLTLLTNNIGNILILLQGKQIYM
jgi:hypothetical protein